MNRITPFGKFSYSIRYAIAAAIILTILFMQKQKERTFRCGMDLAHSSCGNFWTELSDMHIENIKHRELALSSRSYSDKEAYDPFEPTWTCPIEQRIGKEFGDGGKFVCGSDAYFKAKQCLVYSIGSSGDFSFELNVIEKFGCEVHTFDPTGNSNAWNATAATLGISYHSWGLAGSEGTIFNVDTGSHNPLYPLSQIAEKLNHRNRRIDILKIDCEGCEWDAFPSIWQSLSKGEFRMGQVQVEVHGYEPNSNRAAFFDGAEQANFMIFHKERNHWGCQGYSCLEYAFIENTTAWDIFQNAFCGRL